MQPVSDTREIGAQPRNALGKGYHQNACLIVADAARLADQKLLKEKNDAQLKLAALSDLSADALSFLESLNQYVSGTDVYRNRMKGVFKKDIDPKERILVSENISGLRNRAKKRPPA